MSRRIDPVARFWTKVDRSGGPEACWPWLAAKRQGYGAFGWSAGDVRPAHRVAYELSVGPLAATDVLRHRCDNPPCVNPAHLVPGAAADNVHDAMERGRSAHGDRHGRGKLTSDDARDIRYMYSLGWFRLGDLADIFGVQFPQVSLIVRGRVWKGAGGPIVAENQWQTQWRANRDRNVLGQYA